MAEIPADWDSRPPPRLNARTRAFYREDHNSFGEWANSEQLRAPVVAVAEAMKAEAKIHTPRSNSTGTHMRDKYKVVKRGGKMKVHRAFRLVVRVENTDPESALVEFGSANNRRRRMLGKAGARFGDYKPGGDTPR